ncbi:MAG TPA: hypothetical protein PLB89_06690 [Flavobacteriales bacterium]|nr:hypothetical protein [Flavobacteriales bacterium]
MKRALLLLFALHLRPGPLNSCGWDLMSESYRFWLLQPELAAARQLHAFYFTTELLNGPDFDEITQLPYAANLNEWHAVIGNDVADDAITQVLYGMDLDAFEREQEPLFRNNAFLVRLKQLKSGWPEYIAYAKRCEKLVNSEDPWGFIAHDGNGIRKAWGEGVEQLKRARHPQLRARLAFQLVRLAHYAHDAERPDLDARPFYVMHLAPLRDKSWMEPAAAFYLASMLPQPQRDLAFADCFDRATDKQFRMVQLFENVAIDEDLAAAKDDKQRATLLVMRDLQHPGRALEDLERIVSYDPDNAHIPLLLTREVNKLEDWLLTAELTDYGAAIDQWNEPEEGVSPEDVLRTDLDYLHKVQAFIRRIGPQAPPRDQALLTLLDGHLSYVAGEHVTCRKTLAALETDADATPMMRVQARMDRILCGIMATEQLTDATRADVLALVQLVNASPELANAREVILGQLHLYLGKKLLARGQKVEGILLLARTDRSFGDMLPSYWSKNARHIAFEQAGPKDYDSMIALLAKPDKNAFERYLTGTDEHPEGWLRTEDRFHQNNLTRDKLLDYKAMWYLREDRLEEAAATYRKVLPDYWTNPEISMFKDDDPFLVNIHDPHNYDKSDSVRYTRLTIVERMVALKKEAARSPKKRALNNYLLGNAYFSMTWHGKYWGLSRIAWSIHDMSGWYEPEFDTPGDADYYGCARAKVHYLAAMEAAKDPVLKAMACMMAEQCEYNWGEYQRYDDPVGPEPPYLDQLTDPKSQQAYRDILECRHYADFVRRYR